MDYQTLQVLLDSLIRSQSSQELALSQAIDRCAKLGGEYERAKSEQAQAQTALDATKAARRGVEMAMQSATDNDVDGDS